MANKIKNDIDRNKVLSDIIYRMNGLMAHDLFLYIKDKFGNDSLSAYSLGHILEPAFVTSVISGRILLEFLRIKKRKNKEELYPSELKDDMLDDLTITHFNKDINKSELPFYHRLVLENHEDLVFFLKISNKIIAHCTLFKATNEELERLKIVKLVIYNLVLEYMPEMPVNKLNWNNRNDFVDILIR